MDKYRLILFTVLFCLFGSHIIGQTAQVINPDGGAGLTDGLKVQVNTNGNLAVYRQNKSQYFSGYTWPAGATGGVRLNFRFDNGTQVSASAMTMTACSTTAALQTGNDWTTSISGYVVSSLADSNGKNPKFYVTLNFKYTYPNNYFLVDYYVRAPSDLIVPQTVHLYLYHDSYILGSDSSRGYMTTNATGHFVGDYREDTAADKSACKSSQKDPVFPSTHGFKTKNGFRSYFSGAHSNQFTVNNSTLMLLNQIQNASCPDDGVGVEFVIGPLTAGLTQAKQVMHGYGNNKGEFDNVAVSDPVVSAATSSSVKVNFEAANFEEAEGNTSHLANAVKIIVSEGHLIEDQVCNFTISGGTAVSGTDYTYVKGFIIPAGDYATPKTFTLNNITILGNTTCQNNRTFNISIDNEACNDLVIPGTQKTTVYTILDDDTPTVDQPSNVVYCNNSSAASVVFSGNTLPGGTYSWTNSNTSIGLAASGNGNLPSFTAINTTANPITATITVSPKQSTCVGDPKTFTITVNPTPTVSTTLSNITACN
ncbi:MAG: hypothetical protein QM660_15370, partial [Dysgonomonas sp.]